PLQKRPSNLAPAGHVSAGQQCLRVGAQRSAQTALRAMMLNTGYNANISWPLETPLEQLLKASLPLRPVVPNLRNQLLGAQASCLCLSRSLDLAEEAGWQQTQLAGAAGPYRPPLLQVPAVLPHITAVANEATSKPPAPPLNSESQPAWAATALTSFATRLPWQRSPHGYPGSAGRVRCLPHT
ncbi:unnamed protein product, partial [Effrenium voratum]